MLCPYRLEGKGKIVRIYEEIIEVINHRVAQGLLGTGSKLPSIRTLSDELSCSKNSVIKAYQEMENRHLIYSVPKSGYYVVEDYSFRQKDHIENKKIDFCLQVPINIQCHILTLNIASTRRLIYIKKKCFPIQRFKDCVRFV